MTQKQMMEALLNKVADQAAEIALLKQEKEHSSKRFGELIWQRDQIVNLNVQLNKKMEDALDIIESLAVLDAWVESASAYMERAQAFLDKWPATTGEASPTKKVRVIYLDEQREVVANGTGGAHGDH